MCLKNSYKIFSSNISVKTSNSKFWPALYQSQDAYFVNINSEPNKNRLQFTGINVLVLVISQSR